MSTLVTVRILVLWNACVSVSPDEDAQWVKEEVGKLAGSMGVRDLSLHKVESAALRFPSRWDWCLEIAADEPANVIVRSSPYAEFLADLRLLGSKPAVAVLPEATT